MVAEVLVTLPPGLPLVQVKLVRQLFKGQALNALMESALPQGPREGATPDRPDASNPAPVGGHVSHG